MINFICFIVSMAATMFFVQQENYIFFIIESTIMIYYALSAFKWILNTFIKGSNENKFDEEYKYEQKLLEKQERENRYPRKDKLYLNSLNLKDIEWTGTEKKKE